MLKSHFDLSQSTAVQAEEEQQVTISEVQEEILYTQKVLLRADVTRRLSFLGKTAEGDGYTYLKATLTGMGLTNIDTIKKFRHLQFVDLSENNLTLASLQAVTALPYLLLIHADKNVLTSAGLHEIKYLQVMIMNNNQITSVEDVYQPQLSTLEMGFNKINRIHFHRSMTNIRCLDFRHNLIQDISELNFPMLDSLYLEGNKIKSIVGLEKLVNLRVLHLRNNPIQFLDGIDKRLTKLQYINLRNCKVSKLSQVKTLRVLDALDTLIMRGCPYMGGTGEEVEEKVQEEENPELRVEMIALMPKLKRINKGLVSPEERNEANELRKLWLEDGEKGDENEDEGGN